MINIKRIRKYLGHQFVWVNLLAFVLPIFAKLTPMAILVFAVMVLFQSRLKLAKSHYQRYIIWFGSLYLIYVVGGIWTENGAELQTELERKLSLLIFPILFLFTKPLPKKVLYKVLLNFVLGCCISVLLSVYKGWSCFLETGQADCLFSSKFAFGFHPSYLAMYMNLALAILLYFEINDLRPYKIKMWMLWLLILVLIVCNVFLASKMGILTMAMVFGLFAVFYVRRTGLTLMFFKTLALFSVLGLSLVVSPSTIQRFKDVSQAVNATQNKQQNYVEHVESNSARLFIWQEALPLAVQHFFIGVGSGDVSNELVKRYEARGMKDAATLGLNSHNQFLETQLAVGFFGLLILATLVLLGSWYGVKKKNFIYLVFSMICLCNFMVEAMIETQAGVVFFSFFNCFFFVQLNQLSINEGNYRGGSPTTVREGGSFK